VLQSEQQIQGWYMSCRGVPVALEPAWLPPAVAVSGLLIAAGGVDGINVTTVKCVAQKCP